jgi:hypothetical protein
LGSTDIDYISIIDNGDTLVFFKKYSVAVAIPFKMSDDFHHLFLQDKHSFDMINDSCMHFRTSMIGDSIDAMFKSYEIEYVVYFLKREVQKKKNEEVWIMTNPYGQGQPCWPSIYIKKTNNKLTPIKFLSIRRGMCEI